MEKHFEVPTLATLQKDQPSLRAALFDMDGTIFNTEPLHAQIFELLAQSLHIQLPGLEELHERFKGMTDRQVLESAREFSGFPQDLSYDEFIDLKNKKLLELIEQTDPKTWSHPQVKNLLEELRTGQLQVALVTSSERIITEALLKKIGYRHYFDLIITLQDVKNPKPHPGPYIKAMQLLNVGRLDCVIFEDSPTGLEAARASGSRYIKVEWWN